MHRAARIAWELGGVLPRSVGALAGAGDWQALSVTGLRQLGEVTIDELVVTGMTLTGPPPQLPRPLGEYQWAADELGSLGIDAAHPCPDALQVKHIRPRRFGALTFDELIFDHEPTLPVSVLADGHGGVATARVRLYRCGDDARPWLIWVHGAGQGDPMDLLVARVRRLRDLASTWRCRCSPGTGRGDGPGRSTPPAIRWPMWPA